MTASYKKHIQVGTAAALLVGCLLLWSIAEFQPQSNGTFLLRILLLTGTAPCSPYPSHNPSNSSVQHSIELRKGVLEKTPQLDASDVQTSSESFKPDKAESAATTCKCSRDAMISGAALQGLSVGQRKCIAVNLDATTGGRLNLTRQWRDNLRIWEQNTNRLGVMAVVRGPMSARVVRLISRGQNCFTADVIVPTEGEYAIEVLARLEETGFRNQGLLLADPIPVTAGGALEGDAVVRHHKSKVPVTS